MPWLLFNALVVALLVLDLGLVHRHPRVIRLREALVECLLWISLAATFGLFLYFWRGRASALEFTTGYLVEESLSADNLFVFLMIFRYFQVPQPYRHKVLFWGILGALVLRGTFILAGIGLLRKLHWLVYGFGIFLVYKGAHFVFAGATAVQPERNPVLRLFRRWFPVTAEYEGDRFFVRRGGWHATPLLLVLLLVETSDVLFATDSVPAVLAITRQPFIAYTSNVFAILGLRALYFALAGMIERFAYLHYGLALILILIGAKMLFSDYYVLPTGLTLGLVAVILALSILLSLPLSKPSPPA
jgi:tellurite resistance protein TerC